MEKWPELQQVVRRFSPFLEGYVGYSETMSRNSNSDQCCRNEGRTGVAIWRSAVIVLALCSLTWAQQKLVIKADRSRVKSGEILYVTGTGFTPDRAVTAHLIRPDKTEYNPLRLRANAAGELVHKIDTVMLDIGTFELWVEDEASKTTSNRIQFTVESDLRKP
jgi:hypothetical protein